MFNAKKLFHQQSEYDESWPIHDSCFTIFFAFSHFFSGSSRIVYKPGLDFQFWKFFVIHINNY